MSLLIDDIDQILIFCRYEHPQGSRDRIGQKSLLCNMIDGVQVFGVDRLVLLRALFDSKRIGQLLIAVQKGLNLLFEHLIIIVE